MFIDQKVSSAQGDDGETGDEGGSGWWWHDVPFVVFGYGLI